MVDSIYIKGNELKKAAHSTLIILSNNTLRISHKLFKMTKICFLLSILFVVVTVNIAAPVEDDGLENLMELDEEFREDMVEERADRQRRVTCDLLSFGGKIGSSACAANCLSMGKAGGYCRSGICVCRKDSFKDLWKKRFG